ncbi:MAG: hypothetical protein M3O46_14635, partial [Myxococcota bacterium]|nr:hypothetical protein [Myxococcota bacterium]
MGVEENLWSVQSSSGDIRLATIEQLDQAFRAGEIGEGALVRATDEDEWVKLTDLLAAQSPAATTLAAAAVPAPKDPAPRAHESEHWQIRLAHGEVRTGTRQQLEEAVQVGHIDRNTMVLASGAREWVKLSSVFGPSESSPSGVAVTPSAGALSSTAAGAQTLPRSLAADNDILKVRLPGGEVRSGTRKQLDEAMQAGNIDGSALVLASGAREWVRLDSLPWLGQRISAPPASVLAAGAARDVAVGTAPHAGYDPHPSAGPQYVSSPPGGLEEVWQVKLSRRQLEKALRAGHLDESVLVLASGARDWVKLGSALSPVASTRPSTMAVSPIPSAQSRVQPSAAVGPTDANRDIWQVKLANGEVRTGSRHQLVEALQAGHLDASALVLASGTT